MKCLFEDKQCSLYYDASRIPIGCRHVFISIIAI